MKKVRNDLLLIAGVLVAALAAFLVILLLRDPGGQVVVLRDGEEIVRYDLHASCTQRLEYGDSYNVLTIRDGKAWVTEAGCPDQVCVHQGAICYAGETIICLPNRLVVEIRGGTQAPVDAEAR